jgi:hypothetical protein
LFYSQKATQVLRTIPVRSVMDTTVLDSGLNFIDDLFLHSDPIPPFLTITHRGISKHGTRQVRHVPGQVAQACREHRMISDMCRKLPTGELEREIHQAGSK